MLNLHVLDSDGTYIGPLPHAGRIAYLAEMNSPGGGSFEISPDARDANLIVNERIIEVRWLTGVIGHWLIQRIEDPLVGTTRAAMMKISGQGLLGLLRKAVLYPALWPALSDPDLQEMPLMCGPSCGMGFYGVFGSNVDFPFTLNFSPTRDSNFANWPLNVALEFRPGQNMLDVVNGLAGLGYDFILSSSRTLDAYISAGNNRTHTTIFYEGKNLLSFTRTRDSGDHATVVLGAGQQAMVQSVDFSWSTRRRQAYLPVRNAADEQQVSTANALFLEKMRQPVDSYDLVVRNSPVALYEYWLGDTIRVVTRRGQFELRVISVHIEQSGNEQTVTMGVNSLLQGMAQRLATAINGEASVGAAGGGRLVAPDIRTTRPIVTFDWFLPGMNVVGDQQGGVYRVENRLQIIGASGGCSVAIANSDWAEITMDYSLDEMNTWTDLFAAPLRINGDTTTLTTAQPTLRVLQPGTYLRLNVDRTAHDSLNDLSVRLRTREI